MKNENYIGNSVQILFLIWFFNFTPLFSALILLVVQQEGHPASKSWVLACWWPFDENLVWLQVWSNFFLHMVDLIGHG